MLAAENSVHQAADYVKSAVSQPAIFVSVSELCDNSGI